MDRDEGEARAQGRRRRRGSLKRGTIRSYMFVCRLKPLRFLASLGTLFFKIATCMSCPSFAPGCVPPATHLPFLWLAT